MADLILRPHPFSQSPGMVKLDKGQTIQQMLERVANGAEISDALICRINGIDVPRRMWAHVRPKEGTVIEVMRVPEGGGKGSKYLRTILLIVVSIVAIVVSQGALTPYVTGYWATAAGAMVMGAAIGIIGNLAVNALIPPPKPKLPGGSGGLADTGRFNVLTGSSNQANPYGPIPLILGETMLFPPHAALPYSETLANSSYQHCLFDLGYGDLEVDISSMKIGDTALSSYEDVEYEITKTPTLYRDDVNELSVGAEIHESDTLTRTTSPNVEEISLDLIFYQGHFGIADNGNTTPVTSFFTIEYRAVGDVTWLAVPANGTVANGATTRTPMMTGGPGNFQVGCPGRQPFACGASWGVPLGQYEVRISRGTSDWGLSTADARIGACQWTVMRSIRHRDPTTTGTTKIAMRIKATDQLNGTLQTFSCVARQKIPVYDRATSTWSAPTANFNPAWVYYWLLTTCPAIPIHVPTTRVDLDNIADFADFCTAHGFEVRGTCDAATTARALLSDVLACSLGTISLRDGKYGVLFDDGTTTPSMMLTPVDYKGFSVTRNFPRIPHALKVQFRNPAGNWIVDEVVVCDDGYSFRGLDARGNPSALPPATEFETLEIRMAASPQQAWNVGRYTLAQAKFRPSSFELETDVANLACSRGDMIRVASDVTEWGTGWGRVVRVATTGTDSWVPAGMKGIVLDNRIETDPAASYRLRLRTGVDSSYIVDVTPHAPETEIFYIPDSTSFPGSYGDVAVLGLAGSETTDLLLTGITPGPDLSAKLAFVNADSRVVPYWSGVPVAIISEVTGTTYLDPPPVPHIEVLLSAQVNDVTNDGLIPEQTTYMMFKRSSGYLDPLRNPAGAVM